MSDMDDFNSSSDSSSLDSLLDKYDEMGFSESEHNTYNPSWSAPAPSLEEEDSSPTTSTDEEDTTSESDSAQSTPQSSSTEPSLELIPLDDEDEATDEDPASEPAAVEHAEAEDEATAPADAEAKEESETPESTDGPDLGWDPVAPSGEPILEDEDDDDSLDLDPAPAPTPESATADSNRPLTAEGPDLNSALIADPEADSYATDEGDTRIVEVPRLDDDTADVDEASVDAEAENTEPEAPIPADAVTTAPADTVPADSVDTAPAAAPVVNTTSNGGEDEELMEMLDNYEDDGVYGNAVEWNDDWFYQGETYYCGPSSVAFILNQFHGANIFDPDQLAQQAIDLGLEDDFADGMQFDQLPALFEANGMSAELGFSSPAELGVLLELGYGVIAVVDGGEIWGTDQPGTEDYTPDHALVVTQIDLNRGVVTLADPGHPNGNNLEVSLEQFEDAWADSNYALAVTTEHDDHLRDDQLKPQVGTNFAVANLTGRENIR